MANEATVSIVIVRSVLADAVKAGVAADALCAAVGLDPALLDDLDARIPFPTHVAFWREVVARSGDAYFGLHSGERFQLPTLGVVGYIAAHAATFGEALRRLMHYSALIYNGSVPWCSIDDQVGRIGVHTVNPVHHVAERVLTLFVMFGRQLTGVEWAPLAVHFQHPPPPDQTEYQRIFRAPVHFHQSENILLVARAVLDLPNRRADPELCRYLQRHADHLLDQYASPVTFVDQVRRHVLEGLRQQDVNAVRLARQVGVSPRTLHRRLQEHGTSYQTLLDTVRCDLARSYLGEQHLAIDEVAFLLGFAETSTFYRAFKRWTGMTPGEYRR
jgi:AraC-like DNA-binding protein